MKILITGGSGLVGCAIRQQNLNAIYLSSQDGDLTSYQQTYAIFKKHKPTHVIHLAAEAMGSDNNVEIFERNMDINRNVIKCCAMFKVKKCINMLSTCIFSDNTNHPMIESHMSHTSNMGYTFAKRYLEILSQLYSDKCKFICVIPTNIYGDHDNFSLTNGHIIPALIHECYLSLKEKRPMIVRGNGTHQFIYSRDLAQLIINILKNYDGSSIIISPEDEISTSDIALIIASHMGQSNIKFDTTYTNEQSQKIVAPNKLIAYMKKNMKGMTFTKNNVGIYQTISWFLVNYNYARK